MSPFIIIIIIIISGMQSWTSEIAGNGTLVFRDLKSYKVMAGVPPPATPFYHCDTNDCGMDFKIKNGTFCFS